MNRARFTTLITATWIAGLFLGPLMFAQLPPSTQVGEPGRPNYETYRMDKITSQGDASYSGDLNLSLPLLVVPGRHGHDFAVQISYNSHITQSQKASWVGLGWNLDIGAVERTIQGRADDQVEGLLNGDYLGADPGQGNGPPWRAMLKGRMHINQRDLPASDQDQADMYSVIVDGGSTEAYFIPDTLTYTIGYYGPYKLLTPQYKTWDIKASWPNPNTGPVSSFSVTKEDGTQYIFGADAYNNGSVDLMEVQGKTVGGLTQKYSFPYRWSIEKVLYPDGSTTRVTYNRHNQAQNAVRRKYESLIFDRSYAWQANLFSPGLNQPNHWEDSLRVWYSSPESLYTDTHYLVFKSSAPSSIGMSAKNRRLDTLILFDRLSAKELKRVVFKYAASSNPNGTDYPWSDWQSGTMLANNQLTLQSISVRTPDNIFEDAIPPYLFIYGKNPTFDEDRNQNLSASDPTYPGYRCGDIVPGDTVFSTAWRLKSVTLPTGGRTEFSFQRLSGLAADSFKVAFDPEGQFASSYQYSYKAQPRCRLAQKRAVDTLGITQVWTFTYGTAVYDAPSRTTTGTYQPIVYASKFVDFPTAQDYYTYYRGCPIGHRWVKVVNPDGSWKKTYFTSSYRAADKDPLESQPDSILSGGVANNATVVFSNYGRRGMVWKEETNLSSTIYYYSYRNQWQYTDPYRYMWLYDNNYSYKVELRSIWCRLDSTQSTQDGVLHRTAFSYNPTRIQNYGVWNRTGSDWYYEGYPGWQSSVAANGLINRKDEYGDRLTRSTWYDYACKHYGAIDTLFMLSQPYSTMVSGTNDESRDWTTYGKVASLWVPISRWIWNDSSAVTGAPGDTAAPANVRLAQYSYDGSSIAAVVSQTDANGNVTNYYYSSDTTSPFTNNANGLNLGRVTGVEKIRGGSLSPLRTSMIYDGFGNVTKLTSENGNVTRCTYDKLGRLTSIVGPNGQKLSDFSYAYFASSPLQPNILAANSYRTSSDWSASRSFFDGIGYEIQKQVSLGALDIVTHTAYDSMRHAAQRFLAYQCDLGGSSQHKYDPSFLAHTKSYNPGSGNFPYELTEFERDPGGRPINQFYPDTIFSTSDRTNNKYTRISYGANSSGLPDYASGSLHKTTTLDENGNNHIAYVDKLGYTVISVVDSGGLALTTQMKYDASGRVTNVIMPRRYNPPNSDLATGSHSMSKPQHTGQVDLTGLPSGGKVVTLRVFADVYGSDDSDNGDQTDQYEAGITVVCSIDQYAQGNLIAHQGNISLGDYPDDHPSTLTLPYLPVILSNTDEVKLTIDTVYWYYSPPGPNCTSGTVSLDCQVGDFSFAYNKRGLIEQKSVPDQGSTSYLYDKNGNLRFVKDAAHTGTAANATHYSGLIYCPNSTSGGFTLTMPGPVTLTTVVGDIDESEYVTIKIKTNGVYVLSTSSSGWDGSSASLSLPKGSYTYEVTTAGGYGAFLWDVACQSGYEFVYNKYDALNRVTEQGEYSSTSTSANFTKANAENTSFPGSGVLSRMMLYDTVSTDAFAAGQRNLRGKVSQVTTYRLGSVALTSFYSYDDFGRVEWIAYRGFGSSKMKLAYTYDLQNNIIKKAFTDSATSTNNFMWWYEYDQAGRLSRVYSGSDSLSRVKDADYTFSASGKVTQLTLGAAPAQTMTFSYTERDWLGAISSTEFWEHLGYNNIAEIGSALNSPAQYNGNISWMSYSENGNPFSWGRAQSTTTVGYSFAYDKANRLTAGGFGYNYGGWNGYNSYSMPKIGYDKNGNIDTLVRYGTSATLMDNLKYRYSDLANPNRLDYITDAVGSGSFSTDVDNQTSGNYKYDSNGNVQADSGRSMGFIIYDLNNLPILEFKRDGTVIQYTYENNGQRAMKLVGTSYTWYVPGADGKTEVLYNNATTNPTYNLWGNDNVGQVRRTGIALTRYYYLKDHLGTNRMTVRGDSIVIADDFSGSLSQWTTVLGSGFSIQSGELVATGGGGDNVLINNSVATFGDGVVSADVKNLTGSSADANLVVRYQDVNNYYLIQAYATQIIIFKKVAGTYIAKASVAGQQDFLGGFFPLQATVIGANFSIYWKGQQVLTWTDPSPWLSGKVGVRQCLSRNIHWDNFNAVTYTTGQVVAYDDFYPFGMQMDGRSTVIGQPDARYKFTGKERDAETGYDYFGARYYDARIGRWLSVDPIAERYQSLSPFVYAFDSPIRHFDPDGASVKDMIERYVQLREKNLKYGRDIAEHKRLADGSFDNNTIDCTGFGFSLNQADKDSRLVIPAGGGSACMFRDAFINADPNVASYINTSDPTLIQPGDYLIVIGGGCGGLHIMVALETSAGFVSVVSSGNEGVPQKPKRFITGQTGYLAQNLLGIGRVNRNHPITIPGVTVIGDWASKVRRMEPHMSRMAPYSYDPMSGELNYVKPEQFDPKKPQ